MTGFAAALVVALALGASNGAPATPEATRATLSARMHALPSGHVVIRGKAPWLFWANELRHGAHERFWGADAARVAVSRKDADPLRALVAYDRMLKSAGVKLIVVPVPSKLEVYGDQLEPPIDPTQLDGPRAGFLEALRSHGVQVVDLLADLRQIRSSGRLAYLPRDSHWSEVSVRRAAVRVAAAIRAERWYARPAPFPKVTFERATELGQLDLAARLVAQNLHADARFPPPEPVRVDQVKLDGRYVESDRASPVVLAGDSNTLVFHSLLAHHGGLADHLAAQLGFAIDQVGVAGETAIPSTWASLARRMDNVAGKKVVVFCFGERNLSTSVEGWPVLPVVRTPEELAKVRAAVAPPDAGR